MNDPFVGSLTFIRIYSGTLNKGTYLNSVKDKKEKVGRMLEMHANDRKDVDEAFAGDIIALAGMKETTTGDTLCDRSEEHTSELQSLMRISYAVFCLKKTNITTTSAAHS